MGSTGFCLPGIPVEVYRVHGVHGLVSPSNSRSGYSGYRGLVFGVAGVCGVPDPDRGLQGRYGVWFCPTDVRSLLV